MLKDNVDRRCQWKYEKSFGSQGSMTAGAQPECVGLRRIVPAMVLSCFGSRLSCASRMPEEILHRNANLAFNSPDRLPNRTRETGVRGFPPVREIAACFQCRTLGASIGSPPNRGSIQKSALVSACALEPLPGSSDTKVRPCRVAPGHGRPLSH